MSTSAVGETWTDDAWDDDAGWDGWDELEEDDDDGSRFLEDVDLPPVDLPSRRDLADAARGSAVLREMEQLAEGSQATEPVARPTALEPAPVAECQRRAVVDLGARLLSALRAAHQLARSTVPGPSLDDRAVLEAWVFVLTGWLDLLCDEDFLGDDSAQDTVGEVWLSAARLLHQGYALPRSGFLQAVCGQLHEGRGRHHDACGLAQREVWLAARRLEQLGAVTIERDTMTPTGLGRYGVHRWVTDLGGSAPVRLRT